MAELNRARTVGLLNKILEMELAGVVRYTHYSLLVFGYDRIPIVSWLRAQADEALVHAQQRRRNRDAPRRPPVARDRTAAGDPPARDRRDSARIVAERSEALALYRELLKSCKATR